ncbi:MAG: metallophosphoesterase [Candidatus Lernaella stagnicola]|nr:metallophosphoesterase [Candidatus Lernaella stagnicola]
MTYEVWTEFAELMSPTEWIGLAVVLLGSTALWLTAAFLAVRIAAESLGWRKKDRPSRWLRRGVFALCAVYAVVFAYAYWVEPTQLVLKRLRVESAKLPVGTTLRVAHVTDLHAQIDRLRHLERTAEAVVDLQPDIVLLTGDYLCNFCSGAPTALLAFLLRLPDVPVYAVPGNYGGRLPADAILETIGIEILHSESRLFTVAGVPLELFGASPRRRAMNLRPRRAPDRFGIFLEHFPSLLPSVAEKGWDLFLAGHTHGGQVRLPGYGAIVTLDLMGKTFEMGAYQVADTTAMISAGVGMECRWAPQVRLFCPPEIVLIEVVGRSP